MTMLTPDFSTRPEPSSSNEVSDPITELLRGHARQLIAAALEAEVQVVLGQLRGDGRDVVRNGYLPARHVTTAVGDVKVDVPRIRSRDGEVVNFASSMVPKYLRRSQSISAWAAFAYLKGISERDVSSVLEVVLGEELAHRSVLEARRVETPQNVGDGVHSVMREVREADRQGEAQDHAETDAR